MGKETENTLTENIKKLVEYGIQTGLIPETERVYTTNLLLDMFREDDYEDVPVDADDIELESVLKELLDEAVKRGIIEDSIGYRDLFDTKLMNCLVPRPAQVQETFAKKYENSPKEATDYYYKLSQDSDYIRRYRVKKDMRWILLTVRLILRSICPSRRRTLRRSRRRRMRRQAVIPSACSVWRMKDTRDV